ncbi:MAG: hypothetical protein ACR2MB_14720 [Acidimicrobiales bacterium]
MPGFISDQTEDGKLGSLTVKGNLHNYTVTATDAIRTINITAVANQDGGSDSDQRSIGFHSADQAGTAKLSEQSARWRDSIADVQVHFEGKLSKDVMSTIVDGFLPVSRITLQRFLDDPTIEFGRGDEATAIDGTGLSRYLDGSLTSGALAIKVEGLRASNSIGASLGRSTPVYLGVDKGNQTTGYVIVPTDTRGVRVTSGTGKANLLYDRLLGSLAVFENGDGKPSEYQIDIPGAEQLSRPQIFDPKLAED